MTSEQRAERLHYYMYDGLDGIEEHAERIVALEELCAELYEGLNCPTEPYEGCPSCAYHSDGGCAFELRMRELGIEVDT